MKIFRHPAGIAGLVLLAVALVVVFYAAIAVPCVQTILRSNVVNLFAAALGVLGSISLAVPPIRTLSPRRTLGQLTTVVLPGVKTDEAEGKIKQQLLKELERERLLNLAGACLLVGSFVLLGLHSVAIEFSPPQPG